MLSSTGNLPSRNSIRPVTYYYYWPCPHVQYMSIFINRVFPAFFNLSAWNCKSKPWYTVKGMTSQHTKCKIMYSHEKVTYKVNARMWTEANYCCVVWMTCNVWCKAWNLPHSCLPCLVWTQQCWAIRKILKQKQNVSFLVTCYCVFVLTNGQTV